MTLGKIAVVVGVGPGTGGAVAKRFAAGGYSVALVSRRQESSQPVFEDIKKSGGKALVVTADTGKAEDVKRAYKEIVDEFKGSPSVLVYNSGATFAWPPPSILDIDPAQFQENFQVGTTGALLWLQQVVPEQLKAGEGTIILTGATASLRGSAKFALLGAYKAALRSLGQSAARELQPQGIHVAHVIIDGVIKTPRAVARYGADKSDDFFLLPEQIAEEYWKLHTQHRSAWTQELDLRPFIEKW